MGHINIGNLEFPRRLLMLTDIKMAPQSWSVGILCYNEEGCISSVINKTYKILNELCPNNFEIIIVDDGSTDNSAAIIESICTEKNLIFINHINNKGIGEGVRSVYNRATKENLIVIAGDGQFDISEIANCRNFDSKSMISFYRQENEIYNFRRNFLSLINKKVNEYFLGIKIKDVNWAKAIKTDVINKLDLELHSSLIESEVVSKLNYLNYKIIEISSKYYPRIYGESKGGSTKIVIKAAKDILKLYFALRRFKNKNGQK